VLNRDQLFACRKLMMRFIFSLFVSGCELEGLLLVCYVRQGGS